jgi:agmatine deiminase
MNKEANIPKNDGYYMPAEFSPHEGTLIIWPVRPGSWGKDPFWAQEAFCLLIEEISKSEKIFILAAEEHKDMVSRVIREKGLEQTFILTIESDDAWARDVCPTFLTNGASVKGVNWRFNAWGGNIDGLYASWDKDDRVAGRVCEQLGIPCYTADDFVLEGGSIHSDGEGTIMTTESCLLSKGRNPNLTKEQIEMRLKNYLGAEKVLWLPRGIYLDETNEHVDNICAFIAPGEVVLAWTDNQEDEQYPLSKSCLDYLENVRDAKGRRLIVHKLPVPDIPVCVRKEEMDRYYFEEGEEVREAGERLAASYVNFYFTNDSVIVPQFGGENKKSDKRALDILKQICSNRKVVGMDSHIILMGGGNIHCITQQIPDKGEKNE